jgi:hypothetical protein
LDKKLPASKSKGVLKSDSRKFVAVQKKKDDNDDDGILLLSDDDKAGKKVVGRSSDEAAVVTMLKKAEGFFNLPWKDYVSVYAHVY